MGKTPIFPSSASPAGARFAAAAVRAADTDKFGHL